MHSKRAILVGSRARACRRFVSRPARDYNEHV
jgi:hypothetical protein